MRLSYLLFIALFICTAVISAGCIDTQDTSQEKAVSEAISMINLSLSKGADYMIEAADEIAAGKTDPDSSKQVLANLYQRSTLAQTILYANENMIVISVYRISSSLLLDRTRAPTEPTRHTMPAK